MRVGGGPAHGGVGGRHRALEGGRHLQHLEAHVLRLVDGAHAHHGGLAVQQEAGQRVHGQVQVLAGRLPGARGAGHQVLGVLHELLRLQLQLLPHRLELRAAAGHPGLRRLQRLHGDLQASQHRLHVLRRRLEAVRSVRPGQHALHRLADVRAHHGAAALHQTPAPPALRAVPAVLGQRPRAQAAPGGRRVVGVVRGDVRPAVHVGGGGRRRGRGGGGRAGRLARAARRRDQRGLLLALLLHGQRPRFQRVGHRRRRRGLGGRSFHGGVRTGVTRRGGRRLPPAARSLLLHLRLRPAVACLSRPARPVHGAIRHSGNAAVTVGGVGGELAGRAGVADGPAQGGGGSDVVVVVAEVARGGQLGLGHQRVEVGEAAVDVLVVRDAGRHGDGPPHLDGGVRVRLHLGLLLPLLLPRYGQVVLGGVVGRVLLGAAQRGGGGLGGRGGRGGELPGHGVSQSAVRDLLLAGKNGGQGLQGTALLGLVLQHSAHNGQSTAMVQCQSISRVQCQSTSRVQCQSTARVQCQSISRVECQSTEYSVCQ